MIVEQDEVLADRQFGKSADDLAVFDGTRNGPHVHDSVGADRDVSWHVCLIIG
jgi:hypothetical protein